VAEPRKAVLARSLPARIDGGAYDGGASHSWRPGDPAARRTGMPRADATFTGQRGPCAGRPYRPEAPPVGRRAGC
jgi:hypothetical protein